MTEKPPAITTGWQTSEFYQSIASTLFGLTLLTYGVIWANDQAVMWGSILAGASSIGYTAARTIVKR